MMYLHTAAIQRFIWLVESRLQHNAVHKCIVYIKYRDNSEGGRLPQNGFYHWLSLISSYKVVWDVITNLIV